MELSNEQQLAYNKYLQGKNVFITGPGGSGKSALISKIYEDCLRKGKKIKVTALTGCAAVLLKCKARTIHSWSGIGIGTGSFENILKKIILSRYKKREWIDTDILVVDEISMMSLKIFNLLNKIGKKVRNSSKPFGGIQLIFSGDFYQLPPVGSMDDPETSKFCFESEDWNETFDMDCQIQLLKIFRQKDPIYSNILNQIREGKLKKKSNELLLSYVGRPIDPNLVVQPTKLFPTRNKVDAINTSEMNKLDTEIIEYELKYNSDLPILTEEEKIIRNRFNDEDIERELKYMESNLLCEKIVKLKIGAQVMCVVNMELADGTTLCNGSQGIITKINEKGFPIIKFNNGLEKEISYYVWSSENIPGIGISQIPIILAWAITIHKSQGATMDAAEIDVGSGIFEVGQTYVALSRVKSLDGLYLKSFDHTRIFINKKVKIFYENLNKYIIENNVNNINNIENNTNEIENNTNEIVIENEIHSTFQSNAFSKFIYTENK